MNQLTISINHQIFEVEVPVSKKEYVQGLMYRKTLDEAHGMLFLFEPRGYKPSMWMKNTYIPLDMLFVGPDYKIACIIEHTEPLSLKPLSCPEPTMIVIELNAGDAQKYHLERGMPIVNGP